MSTWDQTRGEYQPRLGYLLSALEQLERLRTHEPDVLGSDDGRQKLADLKEGVRRQHMKLQKGEFHVAIVGLEKAGKSTFLNAWLQSELLPNKAARCTFTSTEVRSLSSGEGQQRIEIEFFKRGELEGIRRQYEEAAQGSGYEADLAKKDVEDLKQHDASIQSLLDLPEKVLKFTDHSEVMDLLEPYVANESKARAVKAARLYTGNLVEETGIIFHDVPGYDSPIQMHKNQAREELKRADAVIFITDINAGVNLRDSQLQILKDIRTEDSLVDVRDKVFFFLNKADKADSEGDLKERVEISHRELVETYNVCRPERIVTGAAAVHLFRKGSHVTRKTLENLKNPSESLNKLNAPHGDGMTHLKELVGHYLREERALVLRARCDEFLRQGCDLIDKALQKARQRYPDSLDSFERARAARAQVALANWYDELWEKFKRELIDFWQERIQPVQGDDSTAGENENIDRLYLDYEEAVTRLSKEALLGEEEIKQVYRRVRVHYPLPNQSNDRARKQLIGEKVLPAMDKLTTEISDAISQIIREVEKWVVEYFFGRQEIRALVGPQSDREGYHAELRHGLNALLLRYARPAAEIFIRTRRGSDDRDNMRVAMAREIQILSLYYDCKGDQQSKRKNLDVFIYSGRWYDSADLADLADLGAAAISAIHPVAKAATRGAKAAGGLIKKKQGGVKKTVKAARGGSPHPGVEQATAAPTCDAVQREIIEDSEAFVDYLRNSVYHAASFGEYARQELGRIKSHLESEAMKRDVREIVYRAYGENDPRITKHVEADLQKAEHARRVIEAREQLFKARRQIDQYSNHP